MFGDKSVKLRRVKIRKLSKRETTPKDAGPAIAYTGRQVVMCQPGNQLRVCDTGGNWMEVSLTKGKYYRSLDMRFVRTGKAIRVHVKVYNDAGEATWYKATRFNSAKWKDGSPFLGSASKYGELFFGEKKK